MTRRAVRPNKRRHMAKGTVPKPSVCDCKENWRARRVENSSLKWAVPPLLLRRATTTASESQTMAKRRSHPVLLPKYRKEAPARTSPSKENLVRKTNSGNQRRTDQPRRATGQNTKPRTSPSISNVRWSSYLRQYRKEITEATRISPWVYLRDK